eukprot:2929147-Alexandrium_andersonii.AAC.1
MRSARAPKKPLGTSSARGPHFERVPRHGTPLGGGAVCPGDPRRLHPCVVGALARAHTRPGP